MSKDKSLDHNQILQHTHSVTSRNPQEDNQKPLSSVTPASRAPDTSSKDYRKQEMNIAQNLHVNPSAVLYVGTSYYQLGRLSHVMDALVEGIYLYYNELIIKLVSNYRYESFVLGQDPHVYLLNWLENKPICTDTYNALSLAISFQLLEELRIVMKRILDLDPDILPDKDLVNYPAGHQARVLGSYFGSWLSEEGLLILTPSEQIIMEGILTGEDFMMCLMNGYVYPFNLSCISWASPRNIARVGSVADTSNDVLEHTVEVSTINYRVLRGLFNYHFHYFDSSIIVMKNGKVPDLPKKT